jgi:hypothetical protein
VFEQKTPPSPAQIDCGIGQTVEHFPATHALPAGHWVMQSPQCAGSTSVSTQASPHFVEPPVHVISHLPAAQTSPPLQVLPQVPQLVGSVWMSTHAPAQAVSPSVQVVVFVVVSLPAAQPAKEASAAAATSKKACAANIQRRRAR